MAYNPFVEVDHTELAKLSFTRELCNYVYSNYTVGTMLGQIYEVEKNVYNKIGEILKGSETAEVKKKNRVYVLPGNSLPKKRIKEFLKSKGAYMTSDLEKADVIMGNDKIEEYAGGQASLSVMLFRTDEYLEMRQENPEMTVADSIKNFTGGMFAPMRDQVAEEYNEGIRCIVSDWGYMEAIGYDQNCGRVSDEKFYAYPITLKVLFKILSSRLPVLTQEYVNANAHSDLDIGEPEVFQNIMNMFKSSDNANIELGVEILVHSKLPDTPKAWYHLWRLASSHANKLSSRDRIKNVQYYINATNWSSLRYINSMEYLKLVEEKGNLNTEIFKLLLPDVKEEARDIFEDSEFYDLTHESDTGFVYRLKPKWMKYLKQEKEVKSKTEENEPISDTVL